MYFSGAREGDDQAEEGYQGALPPPGLPPPAASRFAAVAHDYSGARDGGGTGQYAAVGFSYGDATIEQEAQDSVQQQQQQQPAALPPAAPDEPFVPPFLVPQRLRGHLPAGQRQYKVRCPLGRRGVLALQLTCRVCTCRAALSAIGIR